MIIIDSCESGGGSAVANYAAYITHYKLKKKRKEELIKKRKQNQQNGIISDRPNKQCDPFFGPCS